MPDTPESQNEIYLIMKSEGNDLVVAGAAIDKQGAMNVADTVRAGAPEGSKAEVRRVPLDVVDDHIRVLCEVKRVFVGRKGRSKYIKDLRLKTKAQGSRDRIHLVIEENTDDLVFVAATFDAAAAEVAADMAYKGAPSATSVKVRSFPLGVAGEHIRIVYRHFYIMIDRGKEYEARQAEIMRAFNAA